MASKTISKKRTTHYVTGLFEDVAVKIIYYKNLLDSMENFLTLQGIQLKRVNIILKSLPEDLLEFYPTQDSHPVKITVWNYWKQHFTCKTYNLEGSSLPVDLLKFRDTWYLIKSINKQNKCDYCGTYFSNIHSCNANKRDFYHHYINNETKMWWEKIKFKPVGSIKARRLFIIYDIETYTYHSLYGKQLTPYLLVFEIFGSKKMVNIATKLAIECGYNLKNGCFFMVDVKEDKIGASFKCFRTELQMALAKMYWKDFCQKYNIETYFNIDEVKNLNKENKLAADIEPSYMEVYIIGHNICGFDEIVLASHVLEGIDSESLPMFQFSRNFMPRAGKLLFNDITLALPNPAFEKPCLETFERWKQGILSFKDLTWQGLRFMVRDTFLLTHCSLRDAASAYQLESKKGYCPYEAINEYLMLGRYEQENNGYPVEKYWNSKEEYETNKLSFSGNYNILEEAVKYCIEDVKVTSQLAKKLIEGYQQFCSESLKLECQFNIFERPTISSNTQALFKQMYYLKEKCNSEYLTNLEAPSEKMYDFIRMSLRGGRCYPNFLGIFDEPIYVYDICGMYASALTHPMPYGKTVNAFEATYYIDMFQKLLDNSEKIDYFDSRVKPMIVFADCDPPTLDKLDVLPPLCSKKSGKLCWTNESLKNEVVTSIDIITLHNRGWKCKINKSSEIYAVWKEAKSICKDYVKINIEAKEKADKDQNKVQRSISKLLSNALYGSFATKIDKKKVVFSKNMEETDRKRLLEGTSEITSFTTLISKSLPKRSTEHWSKYFENLPEVLSKTPESINENLSFSPFIECPTNHVTFKPITYLAADCDDLVLTTIEDKKEWITNPRYPTQIASFVLAWTRAFMSEWADILYGDDRGKPYSQRVVKSIYGDTDSLFLTQLGHELMLTKGAHRLKKNNKNLIFDELNPCLTWLVECETVCLKCGKEGYSPESCFLAPKLYALKSVHCNSCDFIGSEKVRAKGHAKSNLSYDTLKNCFMNYYLLERPTTQFASQRKSLKRTLQTASKTTAPFTVTETQLIRILRPWKDQTLRKGIQWKNGYLLYPYDKKHPNPRPQEPLTENPFWESL
ncbi:pol [Bovine adenovirus 7]|nr:pol [Bovine adenovirus 7]